jgi:hypothetical protein
LILVDSRQPISSPSVVAQTISARGERHIRQKHFAVGSPTRDRRGPSDTLQTPAKLSKSIISRPHGRGSDQGRAREQAVKKSFANESSAPGGAFAGRRPTLRHAETAAPDCAGEDRCPLGCIAEKHHQQSGQA